jgi:hypothetical protein
VLLDAGQSERGVYVGTGAENIDVVAVVAVGRDEEL